jgi:hypothetical protein
MTGTRSEDGKTVTPDEQALRDRRATGCHYDVGLCACPSKPFEFESCRARHSMADGATTTGGIG